jgi:hypothetical protein
VCIYIYIYIYVCVCVCVCMHVLCVCVCSLSYPAPLLYFHLWPVWLYHIFPHYLTNGTVLGKRVTAHKMCVFYQQSLSETFLILRIIKRDMIINVYTSSCKAPVIFIRFEWDLIFLDIFSKISSMTFNENPHSGSQVIPRRRTDEHDETNSLFPQFCESD